MVQPEDVALARTADAIEELSIARPLFKESEVHAVRLRGLFKESEVHAVPGLKSRITLSLITV